MPLAERTNPQSTRLSGRNREETSVTAISTDECLGFFDNGYREPELVEHHLYTDGTPDYRPKSCQLVCTRRSAYPENDVRVTSFFQ